VLSGAGLWCEAAAHAEPRVDGVETGAPAKASPVAAASLRFEANRGQFEGRVRFLARGMGYGLYLTPEGATLALRRSAPKAAQLPGLDGARRGADGETALVTMRLVGARSVEPSAEGELPGRSNYFVGSDPEKWRTGVESYARVVYADALPGVDVVYYGTETNELEYDLRLGPGVETGSVELAFDGIDSLELDHDGSALLKLAGGARIRQQRPIAYQTTDAGLRMQVRAQYELRAGGKLGFAVQGHDPKRPLVIDPVLTYGTFLGAGNYDELFGVATDVAGNTYVAGYTTGGLFPTSTTVQQLYAGGASDAVVCKINAAGTGFVYSTYLGGSNADQAYGIAADASGNTYVTGVTYSTNFPTASAFQATHAGASFADGFVAKLSSNGATLAYSTYLGGAQDDFPRGIGVGPTGNAYVAGVTFSAGFPTALPLQATLGGGNDAFVSQLSPSGSSLVYSTFLGGSNSEYGNAIATTPTGEVFVVGSTNSNNFPTVNALQASVASGTDAFVSKLNPAGSALAYSTYLGGRFTDNAFGVAQSLGEVIVVGSTTSDNFPVASAAQPALASAGVTDAFISRLSPAGSGLLFSTYLGGTGAESAVAVAVDPQKNTYVVGQTASGNFPLLAPLANQESFGGGATDAFFAAYRVSGEKAFSSYLGGDFEDRAAGVAVQSGPSVHLAGNTLSPDFPTQSPLPNLGTLRGSQDGFVVRSLLIDSHSAVPATTALSLLLTSTFLLGLGLLLAGSMRFGFAKEGRGRA